MVAGVRSRPRRRRVTDLDVVEDRMGQLAALFSEMADGLSEHPESLRLVGRGGAAKGADDAIIVRSSEWPSFEEVQALLARWKQLSAAREPAPSVFPQP
jgi:hypothetical protein